MSIDDTKLCSVEPHFRPPAGYEKFGVSVTLTGRSEVQVPANPFYATLRAPDGTEYRATLSGCRPTLPAVRLTNGKRAEGWISFDVPEALSSFVLEYRPQVIGRGAEALRFQVQR
jgi:hypothetical protein